MATLFWRAYDYITGIEEIMNMHTLQAAAQARQHSLSDSCIEKKIADVEHSQELDSMNSA